MLSRRQFVQQLAAGAAMMGGIERASFATSAGEGRFVFVLLRGGMDGLAAVAPYGDTAYRQLRGSLALDTSAGNNAARKLDGFFALHPAFSYLHGLYRDKQLLLAHAVATSYRERSHFDGQKQLENGTNSPLGARDGWLNRAVASMPGGHVDAIALTQNLPLILYGDAKVDSWSPAVLPEADEETIDRIARLYESDPFFSSQFQSALETRAMAADLGGGQGTGRRMGRAGRDLDLLVKAAGRFLRDPQGPRIAVLESGGWDTHANQGGATGQLANKFARLDGSLALLQQELGDAWKHTVIMVVSEFGRTAAINGSNGTDHGTGGLAFLLGGAVRGGRMLGDWPGLQKSRLYQGRDLMPVTDLRSLFKGVLHQHMQVSRTAMEKSVFPDSGKVRPIEVI